MEHSQELGVSGMWNKWQGSVYMNGSTGFESEDIKMCEVYTIIEIRVGVWNMLRMEVDEVWVQCSVQGLLGFCLCFRL